MIRLLVLRMLALGAAVATAFGATVALAGADKALLNLHGEVTDIAYPGGDVRAVAAGATVIMNDDDVAKTGDRSMGAIVLPDSSRVILGSNTALKLDAFDATAAAQAHFVVAYGKLRFRVEHPAGAKANYTFTTPTGEIAVRGTDGDISVDPFDGVRVNVYHLSDASLPVHVAMINGLAFDIPAGQKIWMRWEKGTLVGKVLPLTQAELDRFNEFGPPEIQDRPVK
jgi:ferric-dicitrate binding protein FerR (iron transport regulator)